MTHLFCSDNNQASTFRSARNSLDIALWKPGNDK